MINLRRDRRAKARKIFTAEIKDKGVFDWLAKEKEHQRNLYNTNLDQEVIKAGLEGALTNLRQRSPSYINNAVATFFNTLVTNNVVKEWEFYRQETTKRVGELPIYYIDVRYTVPYSCKHVVLKLGVPIAY